MSDRRGVDGLDVSFGIALGFFACIVVVAMCQPSIATNAKSQFASEINASFEELPTRVDLANAVEIFRDDLAKLAKRVTLDLYHDAILVVVVPLAITLFIVGMLIATWIERLDKKVSRIETSAVTIEAATRREVAKNEDALKKEDDRLTDSLTAKIDRDEIAALKLKNDRLKRIVRTTKEEIELDTELSVPRLRGYLNRAEVVALCE